MRNLMHILWGHLIVGIVALVLGVYAGALLGFHHWVYGPISGRPWTWIVSGLTPIFIPLWFLMTHAIGKSTHGGSSTAQKTTSPW